MHIFSSRVFNNLQGSLKIYKSEKKRPPGPTLEALDVLGSWRRATEVLQHLVTPSTQTDVVTLSSVASWDEKWVSGYRKLEVSVPR